MERKSKALQREKDIDLSTRERQVQAVGICCLPNAIHSFQLLVSGEQR